MNQTQIKQRSGMAERFASLNDRIKRDSARYELRYLAMVVFVFAGFAAYLAYVTPLWFDEFFTVSISRLSSYSDMLKAMPADGQPPLQYLLTRVSLDIFGVNAFAARLPELMAYVFAGLLTYGIVRRHGTPIQALFALTLLLASLDVCSAGVTARPYCLLLAFTALTFASWQAATLRSEKRFLPLCGVAVGVGGAILSHHFGIFHVGLFLAVGEGVRLVRRRRVDVGMLVAIVIGLSTLVITVPLAEESRTLLGRVILQSTNFWAQPKPGDLLIAPFVLAGFIPLFILALLTLLSRPQIRNSGEAPEFPPVPEHEWAAAVALCLLLLVIYLLAEFVTRYFMVRYMIGASLGMAIVGGWGVPRLSRNHIGAQTLLFLSVLCTCTLWAGFFLFLQLRTPVRAADKWPIPVEPILMKAPKKLPIVIANSLDFTQGWWYSPRNIQRRIRYLVDLPKDEKQSDFLPELSLAEDQAYIPFPVDRYASFIAVHREFLLLRSGEPRLNWTEARLTRAGWHLSVISRSGDDVLYRVTAPSGAGMSSKGAH